MRIRLETEEQQAFVSWLELAGLRFTAVPLATFTRYHSQKLKNHREGVRAGFPDLVVLVPPLRSRDGRGKLLCIEMKRVRGGTVSPEQRAWLAALDGLGSSDVVAKVCKGCDEAIELVQAYLTSPVSLGSPF